MSDMNVAIIGGGVSGLTCGYQLSQNGITVDLYESQPLLGGLAGWYRYKGLNIPKTYHHILRSDATLLQTIEKLKLKVKWKKVRVGFYKDGKIHPFNGPIDLLRFKLLPFLERIKLGLLVLSTRAITDIDSLTGISVEEWIKDRVGYQAFKNLIDPLVSSYFGSSKDISAAYLANRWKIESQSITGFLGYLDISEIVNGLEKEILNYGGSIRRNSSVTHICVKNNGFKLKTKTQTHYAKYLVSTIPVPLLLQIIDSPILEQELGIVKFKGCICVTYWMKERVSDYYWINILDRDFPFIATFEHANLNSYVKGGVVYAVTYLDEVNDLWKKKDEDIANHFSKYLSKIYSKFGNVTHYEVFRTPWSTPVYEIGFRNPPLKTSIDGLYIAGINRIFPNIRSMGPPMKTGLEAAEIIIRELK